MRNSKLTLTFTAAVLAGSVASSLPLPTAKAPA